MVIINNKGLKLGLGVVLLTGGLFGGFNSEGSASAEVVKQSPLSNKYKDGRYDSKTDMVSMGYRAGIKTYDGNKIEKVDIKTANTNISKLDKESSIAKYNKSNNKNYVNNIIYHTNTGRYLKTAVRTNYYVKTKFNNNQLIDKNLLNTEFIKLVNKERARLGVKPLKYSSILQEGTDTRAQELANHGSIGINGKGHIRLNSAPFWTAFTNKLPKAQYELGENLASNPYYGNPYELISEKSLAEKFYSQWKGSKGHYKNMMNPKYKTVAFGVKLSGAESKPTQCYDSFVGVNILRDK